MAVRYLAYLHSRCSLYIRPRVRPRSLCSREFEMQNGNARADHRVEFSAVAGTSWCSFAVGGDSDDIAGAVRLTLFDFAEAVAI